MDFHHLLKINPNWRLPWAEDQRKLMDTLTHCDYTSKHRSKLEEKGWSYVGSIQVPYKNPRTGESILKWRNYFEKGPHLATTIEALRMEGIK